ncbi:UNVERIFIED_CONTAM: hypothetical protein HDU68_004802 [Siphonaria sp. JEL0065]|nr:hypothetical protein HDU68_004802 [Siphonaria sp. JEL0065]
MASPFSLQFNALRRVPSPSPSRSPARYTPETPLSHPASRTGLMLRPSSATSLSNYSSSSTANTTEASSTASTPTPSTPIAMWRAARVALLSATSNVASNHDDYRLHRVPSDCTLLADDANDENDDDDVISGHWDLFSPPSDVSRINRLSGTQVASFSEESERFDEDGSENYLTSSSSSSAFVGVGGIPATPQWHSILPPAATQQLHTIAESFENVGKWMEESEICEDGYIPEDEGDFSFDSVDRNEDQLDTPRYSFTPFSKGLESPRRLLLQHDSSATLMDFSLEEDWRDDQSGQEERVSEYASSLGEEASPGSSGATRRSTLIRSLIRRGQSDELVFIEL